MTASSQMYLKAIYCLSAEKGKTRVAKVAQALSVSRPSVSNALKALDKSGYIMHEPYGDITLTPRGKTTAQAIIRTDERLRQFCFCE